MWHFSFEMRFTKPDLNQTNMCDRHLRFKDEDEISLGEGVHKVTIKVIEKLNISFMPTAPFPVPSTAWLSHSMVLRQQNSEPLALPGAMSRCYSFSLRKEAQRSLTWQEGRRLGCLL